MVTPFARIVSVVVLVVAGVWVCRLVPAQDAPPVPVTTMSPPIEPLPVPKGVEVQARGPVHEAFATLTTEPEPTKPVAKKPPKPIDELPPDEKPVGDMVWISGYWAYDDERNDYLWVSGIWRAMPPHKHWIAGYWRDGGDKWQWVPGFWTANKEESDTHEVTYYPKPEPPPEIAPPGKPPSEDAFYVPGNWVWVDRHYAWKPGYWARVQPGYVWVPAHYRWTPSGYVYISGYWDLVVSKRGVLYAPVFIDADAVGDHFVYTPAYAVSDTVVLDAMFVRPCYCHYYFGDYYGPVYRDHGYTSCVVYSRDHYDAIVVYERWDHRREPEWERLRIEITFARHEGRAPVPPRTLVQQNIVVNKVTNVKNVNVTKNVTNNQVLMPASQLAAAKGIKTQPLDPGTRQQAKEQAQSIQQVAMRRTQTETPAPPNGPSQPRVASLPAPKVQPVGSTSSTASSPPLVKSATSTTPTSGPTSTAGGTLKPTGATTATGAPGTSVPPAGTLKPTGATTATGAPGTSVPPAGTLKPTGATTGTGAPGTSVPPAGTLKPTGATTGTGATGTSVPPADTLKPTGATTGTGATGTAVPPADTLKPTGATTGTGATGTSAPPANTDKKPQPPKPGTKPPPKTKPDPSKKEGDGK